MKTVAELKREYRRCESRELSARGSLKRARRALELVRSRSYTEYDERAALDTLQQRRTELEDLRRRLAAIRTELKNIIVGSRQRAVLDIEKQMRKHPEHRQELEAERLLMLRELSAIDPEKETDSILGMG